MDEDFERRKFKRCVVTLPIEIKSGAFPVKGVSYDISVGGVCVHSKEHFPINSSVHIILSIPLEKEETVREIKIIGKVLRVDEMPTDQGSVNAHGVKFKSIGNEDLIILKNYLKSKYCHDKKVKESKNGSAVSENEKSGGKVKEILAEIKLVDIPKMNFFQRLFLREDYSIIFTEFSKWILKSALLVLLFYVTFHLTLLVLKLVMSR